MNRVSAYLIIVLIISSCKEEKRKPVTPLLPNKTFTKAPSSFQDTMEINTIAAVFYQPDSIQLVKIRSVKNQGEYESQIHEYEYLFKTARAALKKDFPAIKIFEAKNIRYLLFRGAGTKDTCIDLDKIYEPFGLYLYNRQKLPLHVDMYNIETELGFYFSE